MEGHLMPAPLALTAAFWGSLGAVLTKFAVKILGALGITAVTVVGAEAAFNALQSWVFSHLTGLPATALQVIDVLNFDIAFGVLVSAKLGEMAFRGAKRVVAE